MMSGRLRRRRAILARETWEDRLHAAASSASPRTRRASSRLALALALLLAGLAGSCGDEGAGPGSGRGAPGIVLLCVDTLRADAFDRPLGGPGRMPALASFAGGATVFKDASAGSSWTAP